MTVKDIYITDYTIHNLKVKKLSKKDFSDFLLRGGFYAEQNFAKYPTQKLFGLRVFLISIITATALFLPFIIMGGGVFYYYGDFNVQEIPFYQLVHDAVRNGDIGWMHNVDLGTDMLSSFSFYLLGSPFFWLTIPFPSEAVPYLIGPLLILKFGCASLSAYLYLKRYVADRNFALVGGLLYAFSGFSIYNVFFSTFMNR